MKKALKVTGKILLSIVILFAAALLICFVVNRILMKSEESLLEKPMGQLVEVDGHNMHVYTEGQGDHTLLFLSGSGTAAPALDFKSLYSQLSGEYKIAVVEKYGYGFSDVVDCDRDFEVILRQDREALEKAGVSGPYILCPHSMSGIEAILWAQEHPEEVEGIVGLDMALPRHYDELDLKSSLRFEKLAAFGREAGVVRFGYLDSALPEKLTKDEKKLYRAIGCKKACNVDVMNEGVAIPDACRLIDSRPKPDVPMLMFTSDGKETGCENWITAQYDYAEDLTSAKVIELNCGHYVHNFEYQRISGEIRTFTEGLQKN
ncbi:MAG: alpha/beta hydrolase [Ruminococcus sp.]|nr:alpha/beta hydrolase [Ruminococcus sp.]